MIKIDHVVLPSPEQMEFIIEGMRNPLNSWNLTDSNKTKNPYDIERLGIGEKDLNLMTRLSNGGSVHRKYMRMMVVFCRVTAPLYWWKEAETHKIGTVSNSCSTMHKIQAKEFTLDDFSHEHLYNLALARLKDIIDDLNLYRELFLESKKKEDWWQMIQLLPSSYNQTRNLMLNYEVLAAMYYWRKNHKLDEWREFCKWIETLPYSELITQDYDGKE